MDHRQTERLIKKMLANYTRGAHARDHKLVASLYYPEGTIIFNPKKNLVWSRCY